MRVTGVSTRVTRVDTSRSEASRLHKTWARYDASWKHGDALPADSSKGAVSPQAKAPVHVLLHRRDARWFLLQVSKSTSSRSKKRAALKAGVGDHGEQSESAAVDGENHKKLEPIPENNAPHGLPIRPEQPRRRPVAEMQIKSGPQTAAQRTIVAGTKIAEGRLSTNKRKARRELAALRRFIERQQPGVTVRIV